MCRKELCSLADGYGKESNRDEKDQKELFLYDPESGNTFDATLAYEIHALQS